MNTKVQKNCEGQKKLNLIPLSDLKILPDSSDLFRGASLLLFGFRFNDFLRQNEFAVNRKDLSPLIRSTAFALQGGFVSKYQYSCLRKISQILYDSKLMNENNLLSDLEFKQIVEVLYSKIIQKMTAIKNAADKAKLANAGLDKGSLNKLRAQVATLQNEN